MKHGEVLPGILAELGVPVNVQHNHIKVRNGKGAFKVPGAGESFVRKHQFPPKPVVGFRGYAGKKPPMEVFDEFKYLQNNRMSSGISDYRLGKFHQGGKSRYLVPYHAIIEKRKQLIFRD
jgi:hypothetical protein